MLQITIMPHFHRTSAPEMDSFKTLSGPTMTRFLSLIQRNPKLERGFRVSPGKNVISFSSSQLRKEKLSISTKGESEMTTVPN